MKAILGEPGAPVQFPMGFARAQTLPKVLTQTLKPTKGHALRWRPSWINGRCYSALRVIEGSTCAARHAGTQHAMPDTPVSNAITKR